MPKNLFDVAYSIFGLGGHSPLVQKGAARALPPGYVPHYEYGKLPLQDVNGYLDKDGDPQHLKEVDCTGLLLRTLTAAGYVGFDVAKNRFSTADLFDSNGNWKPLAS